MMGLAKAVMGERKLPPATKLGQGYAFTGVCDSVHRGGVPDQVHPPGTRYTPRPGTPPRTGTPPDQVHPRPGTPPCGPGTPPDQVHPHTRYTPWTRYTPPDQVHTPRPGTPPDQVHPPSGPGRYGLRSGGMHPTGMQSCFNS